MIAKPDYVTTEPLDNEKSAAKFYKSKPMSYDADSPYFRWEREWNGQEIQDAVQANIAAQIFPMGKWYLTNNVVVPNIPPNVIISS